MKVPPSPQSTESTVWYFGHICGLCARTIFNTNGHIWEVSSRKSAYEEKTDELLLKNLIQQQLLPK
jgi:hypothetical protein